MTYYTFILLAIVSVFFIVYQLAKFSFFINSSRTPEQREFKQLKEIISPYMEEMVPLTLKELSLLSINQENRTTRHLLSAKLSSGVVTSIYHEPLLAYAFKQYKSSKKGILLIVSSESEFYYTIAPQKTIIKHNDTVIGEVDKKGNLISSITRQPIASIALDDVLQSHSVYIGGREVGEIINPMHAASPNPRAYDFLEPMDQDEKIIFQALTFWSLIEESL